MQQFGFLVALLLAYDPSLDVSLLMNFWFLGDLESKLLSNWL